MSAGDPRAIVYMLSVFCILYPVSQMLFQLEARSLLEFNLECYAQVPSVLAPQLCQVSDSTLIAGQKPTFPQYCREAFVASLRRSSYLGEILS